MERHEGKTCHEVRADLPLYVGRDLPQEELAAIDAHIAGCADCQAELAAAQAARRALLALREAPEPEIDLWAGVSARIAGPDLHGDDLHGDDLRDDEAERSVVLNPADRSAHPDRAAHRRPRLRRVAGGLAVFGGLASAAAAIALVFAGGFWGSLQPSGQPGMDPADLVRTNLVEDTTEPVVAQPASLAAETAPASSKKSGGNQSNGLQRINPADALRHRAADFDAAAPIGRTLLLNPNRAASSSGQRRMIRPGSSSGSDIGSSSSEKPISSKHGRW